MIETPNTLWKPTANTASHISGRTSADNRRALHELDDLARGDRAQGLQQV